MKYKSFVILLILIILLTSSGSALAQGSIPPSDLEALTKSAFLPSETYTLNRQAGPRVDSPLDNGGFEQGAANWLENSNHGWDVIRSRAGLPIPPHSGDWAVWLGGDHDE